jgi:phage tail-like protein
MADDRPNDPYGSFYYALELDGIEVGHFLEVSGLKSTAAKFEIQEGGLNNHVHFRAGVSKWENLVLRFATHASQQLYEWKEKSRTREFTEEFETRETTGAIVLKANDGEELRRFNFTGAWPVSWEGPTFNSDSSELAIETLEIAHEGIYIDEWPPEPEPQPEPEPDPDPELGSLSVEFNYDSDTFKDPEQAQEDIAAMAEQLDEQNVQECWVEGHTCTDGSFSYNQGLSLERAEAVVAELETQSNMERTYHAEGFSWKYPKVYNSPSNRPTNRRSDLFSTSWEARGRDTEAIADSRKYDDPWKHS